MIISFLLSANSLFASIHITVKDGNWSDTAVWNGSHIPLLSDSIVIKHKIFFDEDISVHAKGYLRIDSTAVLCGYHSIKISCGAFFYNSGTMKAKSVDLEGEGENAGDIFIAEYMQVNTCGQMFSFGAMTVGIGYECNSLSPDTPVPATQEIPQQITDTAVTSLTDSSSEKMMFKVFPNPVASDFEVSYFVPADDIRVSLSLYNSSGKLIAVLSDQLQKSGNYRNLYSLKSLNLSTGIYFIRFSSGENISFRKILKAE